MAINFYRHSAPQAERLHVDKVKQGQKLVRMRSFGGITRFETYEVVRSTPTRLIIVPTGVESPIEIRIIAESGKYSDWNRGNVTTRREAGDRYSDDWYLFTEDEPLLAVYREEAERAATERSLMIATRAAVRKLDTRHIQTEDAEAAIVALQALVAHRKATAE